MKISMHTMASDSFVAGLESLAQLLDKGAAFGKSKDIDLIDARLAPDMFTFARQVQQVCHYAVDGTSRLTGRGPGTQQRVATSFEELKADIESAIEYVRGIPASEFAGAEDRDCSFAPPNADFVIRMDGLRFLRAWALPHFYFHLVTAYDILRHEGVALGKPDFMSWVSPFIEPRK